MGGRRKWKEGAGVWRDESGRDWGEEQEQEGGDEREQRVWEEEGRDTKWKRGRWRWGRANGWSTIGGKESENSGDGC